MKNQLHDTGRTDLDARHIDEVFSDHSFLSGLNGPDGAKAKPGAPRKGAHPGEFMPEKASLTLAPAVTDRQRSMWSKIGSLFASNPRRRSYTNDYRHPFGMQVLERRVVMDGSGVLAEEITGIDKADWGEVAAGSPDGWMETMAPHQNSVMNDVALSADGRTMATSARDGKVYLRDAETGALQRVLTGHTGNVVQVEFSPDGAKVASVSYDKTARVWDAATGALLKTYTLPELGTRVEFSPDGNRIAVGIATRPTQLIDLRTNAVEHVSYSMSTEAARFDFTPDGTGLVHTNLNTVFYYDLNTRQVTRNFQGLADQVYCVDIDPTGRFIAAGDNGGSTAVWDIGTGQKLVQQKDHVGKPTAQEGVWAIQFDATSTRLLSADYSGRIILRDVSQIQTGAAAELVRYQGPMQPGTIVSTPKGDFVYNTAKDAGALVMIIDAQHPEPVVVTPEPEPVHDGAALEQELLHAISQPATPESPIAPDLSVVKIDGLNIVVALSSPHDQSLVSMARGIFSQQLIRHEGGTTFGLAHVTFDKTQMSGEYWLTLTDGMGGAPMQKIWLKWDQRNNALSLMDPADRLENAEQVDTAVYDRIMNLTTTTLGDAHINWIQQARLYQMTNQLPAPYDFDISGAELEQKIYAAHPEYLQENAYEEIMRRWREDYPTYESGFVESLYNNERIAYFNRMIENLAFYEKAMLEFLQTAANGLIRIRQGGTENELDYSINQLLDKWINPVLNAYKADAARVADLQNIGIYLPSRTQIIEATRRVLDIGWEEIMGRQEDVEAYRDSQKHVLTLRSNGWDVNETGQWVITDPTAYFASLMRDEGVTTLTALLEQRCGDGTREDVMMAILDDPFVSRTLAQTTMSKQLAYESGEQYVWTADGKIMNVKLASFGADDSDVGGSPYGSSIDAMLNAEVDPEVLNELRQLTQRQVFNQVLEWSRESSTLERKLHMQKHFPIRTDTLVGQIMMSAAEKLFSTSDQQEWWRIAARLQIVTDIPAERFFNIRHQNGAIWDFGNEMLELMNTAQYTHLTVVRRISETPYAVSAKPNIPARPGQAYTTADPVRIRFDAVTHGRAIVNVEAIFNGQRVAQTGAATYIDIPVQAFDACAEFLTVTLKIHLSGGGDALEIVSDPFNTNVISWNTTNYDLSVNPDASQRNIENVILNSLAFPVDAGGWSYGMGSTYHAGRNLYALDLNLSSNPDRNLPVYVAASGQIIDVNIGIGKVLMRHVTTDGIEWFTEFHHLTHILESVTGITYIGEEEAIHLGLTAEQKAQAAEDRARAQEAIDRYLDQNNAMIFEQSFNLARVGSEGDSSGPHVHFVASVSGRSINLFQWADKMQPGFTVTGNVGTNKNLSFIWNEDLNVLFNNAEKVSLARVNSTNSEGVTIAENQVYVLSGGIWQRVTWNADRMAWFHYENSTNSYTRTADGKLLKWDAVSSDFIPQ